MIGPTQNKMTTRRPDGYEPLGVVHDVATFPEYTELLFTNYRPTAFPNKVDSVAAIFDHAELQRRADQMN